MNATCIPLVRYSVAVVEGWLSTAFAVAGLYLALLDPRPDLAVPARGVKLPYLWWW